MLTALTIILVVLKALGFIGLAWHWVFAPLIIEFILIAAWFVIVGSTALSINKEAWRRF